MKDRMLLYCYVGLSLRIERFISLHSAVDDGMIHFAANTAAQTVNAFEWAGQSPTLLLPPYLIHGLLGLPELVPNDISIASAVFAGFMTVTNRQTRT